MRNFILFILLISFCLKAQSQNLNSYEQRQLQNILISNYCSCGCQKTILQCLETDPSCTSAPKMAQSIVDEIVSNRQYSSPRPGNLGVNNSGGNSGTFEDNFDDFCAQNGGCNW